jgi:hypothetical protein
VIYCINREANKQWSKVYDKVKTVVVSVSELIQKVQEFYKDLIKQQASSSIKNEKFITDFTDEPEKMSTLIHRLMDQPLLSLTESLKEVTVIIPNLDKHIEYAVARSKNPADGLTSNESAAIYIYTMNWKPSESTLCRLLNKDLRSESHNALKKWYPYLKLLLHALNKLPSYEGTVYRGLTINITDQFVVGQTGTWWSVSASTSMMSMLESSEYLSKSGSRTLFSIECKNGKCIRKHSYFEIEDAILLLPGFNFEVTNNFNAGNGLHIISLKEIGTTPKSVYVLWLDPSINKSQENKDTQEKLKELFHDNFIPFEQLEGPVQYIEERQNQRFLLITGGQIGRQIVPKINNLSQLYFIVVYCMDKQANEQWSKDYKKVKAVVVKANEMVKTVQKFYQDLTAREFGCISHLSHPLHGIMDQPLLSLAESLQEITHLIPHLQNYINITLMKCMNPANNLTPNESAAIQIYTMEWEPSESCLSRLLNKDLLSESQNALKKWFPFLKLFLHALNKLPSYKGIVWHYIPGDLTRQFLDKQTGIWWAILSTVSNMSFLKTDAFFGGNSICTLFSIECTNGKRIADEILLLPGFYYQVTSQLDLGNGLHIIGLKEIDSPY